MIGLNKIGLNQVQLNQLYLNTLCTGQKSSGGDGFPRLPGDVTRWSFKGLTNEMMSKNPRLEDADHKGRFLTFKNFAWSGMSGVDGYKFNFLANEWVINNDQVSEKYSYKIVINNKQNSVQLYNRINLGHIKITLKITGIEINKSTFRVYDNAGTEHAQDYTKDGIYEIDYTANEGANIVYFYVFGGNMGQLENPITIEQLPLYPDALVFDGVDDYGICENFPILTKEKGYTVVALRQWISMGKGISGLVSNVKNWFNDGAFVLEYNSNNATNKFVNRPVSFGNVNIEMDLPNNFAYQTSKSYKGVPITTGSFKGTNSLFVGKLNSIIGNSSNVAIWELVFLDHDATEEELTKIKDYFIKTYPWLFFDQAWTVTGKTNEDTDSATITNITGNGNNLVLSNFGFAEGSGYNEEGEYAGYLVTDGVDDIIRSSAFTVGKDWTTVGEWEFLKEDAIKIVGIAKFGSFRFYNYSFIGRMNVYINSDLGTNVIGESVKAATSKGSVYLDFNSVTEVTPGDEVDLGQSLFIGYNANNFTKLAFKNLAIYSAVLSKEDMIKAYIYLQTLKAK